MELAIITIKKITEMFLIMMIGMAAFRCRIVDGPANKRMSGLTLNVIAPVTMFMSYQIGFQAARAGDYPGPVIAQLSVVYPVGQFAASYEKGKGGRGGN